MPKYLETSIYAIANFFAKTKIAFRTRIKENLLLDIALEIRKYIC